jgi:hypothetical protein
MGSTVMSNVNEFNASNSSSSLRAYTTQEQAVVDALALAEKTVVVEAIPSSATYKSITSSTYTLAADDIDKLIEVTHASGTTITIPSDATDETFPIGWSTEFRQTGDGRITFQATSPATLVSTENYTKTRLKYSSAMVEKRASNSWILVGDIDA